MTELTLVIIGLLFSAFFAGSETAFIILSGSSSAMSRAERKLSMPANFFLQRPNYLLTLTLIGTNIAIVTTTSGATKFLIQLLGTEGEFLALIAVSFLILFLCEIVPKNVALRRNLLWANVSSFPLFFLQLLLLPALIVVQPFVTAILFIVKKLFPLQAVAIRKEELIRMVKLGQSQLPPEKKNLFKSALELGQKRVLHYAVPLGRFPSVSSTSKLRNAIKKARTHKLLELPVYKDTAKDNIIGVIRLVDIIREQDLTKEVAGFVSPLRLVPAKMMITQLLSEPALRGTPLLGITDEHGRIKGYFVWEDFISSIARGLLPGENRIEEA